ncbi:MAG: hypothetical protein ACI4QN_02085 [Candidatus Coproplasma sp.]
MDNIAIIQDDILRYKKNKFASSFALLALVFNCLYFALLYAISAVKSMFDVWMGVSVIVNLLVLLMGFYASEGIKGYNKKFSLVLLILAVLQLVRIIYFPAIGMSKEWLVGNYFFGIAMTNASNGVVMIVFLVASAACFIVSAVQGYIVAKKLETFQKKLDNGEVSIEKTLAEIDAEEEKSATEAVAVSENVETVAQEAPAEEEAIKSSGEDNNG